MKTNEPLVAIIIPVYNSGIFLEATIKAIYNSTNFPFKLILVENKSTDDTPKTCEKIKNKYSNVEVYHMPKKGMIPAINFGIKKAKDLDVYLTQDDVIHFKLYRRDWLLEMYNIAKKKNVGIIMGLDGGGISGDSYIEGLKWAGTWNTYIPRRTIKAIGLFDENMLMGVDIDYSYRISEKGLKGVICNFWVQHHKLTELRIHEIDAPRQIKEGGEFFKKKWGFDKK